MKRANIKILLFGSLAIITAFVPPAISNSQKDTTPSVLSMADSLNREAKAFAKGVDSINNRIDALSPSVYANQSETYEIRGWVRRIMSKKVVKKVPVVKPVAVAIPVPVPVNTIAKEVVVRQFIAPVYRDTTKRKYWKSPGEDGLIKQLFKKRK